jgi:steroid delta-isomerase
MALPDTRLKQLAERYLAAINAGSAQAVLALFAPGATVEDPVGGELRRGADAIGAFYRGALAQGISVELEQPPCGSFSDAAAYAMRVTTPKVSLRVIGVLTFDSDERITSMKAYHGPSDLTPRDGG